MTASASLFFSCLRGHGLAGPALVTKSIVLNVDLLF